MAIELSLTQFLTYSSKVSTSAKINYVRQVKNSEYDPSVDYWKKLRDEIKKTHEKNLPIEDLLELPKRVSEKKAKNYQRAVTKYVSFIRKNNASYFPVGKSFWSYSDDLFVRTSPEIGLTIDGKNFLVKNYYKKKDTNTKVTKRNIGSTLTMMQLSEKDFAVDSSEFSVLNLQNGGLITAKPLMSESVLELELEAQNFVNIWNKV
ncbi:MULTISPECIES: hypothetical protein [Listeria]|uniref:hypothetical protein n=1 Tax=Listeria TaxID=1637 RepID=UPI000CDA7B13|nr:MULTISPECIES: hypothetical protein [Listeria]AVI19224.1 hypothetical protein C4881_02526 [Listeria monocytogenes]EAC4465896.1 hypothetical protein [Listeria monocytogenes]EAC4481174.1 hypothetical protein [Listeria monocytogenes]EAC6174067.1 hypothetical protein [Listeria monocytogenes]EAD5155623.1 hypothetical protein [Listeria monocytogenes]